jgi:hypothetical protein
MQNFVNHENIARYRKLITIAQADPSRDEARYQTLLRLLAEERAKDARPVVAGAGKYFVPGS